MKESETAWPGAMPGRLYRNSTGLKLALLHKSKILKTAPPAKKYQVAAVIERRGGAAKALCKRVSTLGFPVSESIEAE
ncbi:MULTISPECIES: hypothetical protein [unclassified Janthinobacterium]|uniref:hypothetical protein n=1 Tax=unclassified Janthinobacterium TaxID=2610881 RepID=UPI00034D2E35|nr:MULTISPECIES: hypothetical protein [unclassified Janthinobacterium]MEC5162356.1 hypothetical protein [Janthinobacterium sp. CG_S6]